MLRISACPHCREDRRVKVVREVLTETADRSVVLCEGCGARRLGRRWTWTCTQCKRTTEPGGLGGLFIPHLCRPCLTIRRQTDRRCSLCGSATIDCAC